MESTNDQDENLNVNKSYEEIHTQELLEKEERIQAKKEQKIAMAVATPKLSTEEIRDNQKAQSNAAINQDLAQSLSKVISKKEGSDSQLPQAPANQTTDSKKAFSTKDGDSGKASRTGEPYVAQLRNETAKNVLATPPAAPSAPVSAPVS